jgi:hypothetical protein
MSNNKQYKGKLLATFFPTSSGKSSRCYTLGAFVNKDGEDCNSYLDLMEALQSAKTGCKLSIRDAPKGFRPNKDGVLPTFILEVFNAEELASERDRMKANDGDGSL